MAGQLAHFLERVGLRDHGLQREPLVDDQGIGGIAVVEIGERLGALRHVVQRQRAERGYAVGHVVGGLVLPRGARDCLGPCRRRHQIEADIAQRAAAGALCVGRVAAVTGHALVKRRQRRPQAFADLGAQSLAGAEDRVGVDVAADLARDVAVARRDERQRNESGLQCGILQKSGECRSSACRRHAAICQRAGAPRCRSTAASKSSAAPASG